MDDRDIQDDPWFFRAFAVECEADLSASIICLGLQAIVRGIRFVNWPIFLYNFFLHLLSHVETVVIEGRGSRYVEESAPVIPCPFLLPPSVIKLHLIRIMLYRYSLEAMLSPDGHLQRLYIEGIEDGLIVSILSLPRWHSCFMADVYCPLSLSRLMWSSGPLCESIWDLTASVGLSC